MSRCRAISSTHSQDPNADQIDGKSSFNRGDTSAISGLHHAPQATSPLSCAQVADKQNLPLSAGGSSLTLSSSTLQDPTQWERSADTQGLFEQEQKRAKEHWCQAQGKELAGIFDDQKSLNFYVGVHRVSQDPQLIRAIFIKALYQEQCGGFRDSIGAYFNFMWKKVWGPFRTYDAACAKWQKWGNKRDPKGIPPDIQNLVECHQHDSYTQIAITMGHRWPEAEQTARLDTSSSKEAQQPSMTRQEAQDLIEAIGNSARWYLQDPQIYRADALYVDYGGK